jgi:hypothetical protein
LAAYTAADRYDPGARSSRTLRTPGAGLGTLTREPRAMGETTVTSKREARLHAT